MSGPKHLWNGSDPKAMHRMKKLFELEKLMFRKQQARDGLLGVYPMRLLREDIARRRCAKERERGWINSYKGAPSPRAPFGYMDRQLVLGDKIIGYERESPQTFFAYLNKSKGKKDVNMQGRERGWTNSTHKDSRSVNETLYGMCKPNPGYSSHYNEVPEFKLLQGRNMENARRLEAGWVCLGREHGKGRTGSGGSLGRSRGLTASELRALQKERTERASITGDASERSEISSNLKNFRWSVTDDWSSRKENYDLVVPIGTLERSGFGNTARASSLISESSQSLESGYKKTDEDILKKGIEKEEKAGWMSSYKRKQTREMYGLAKLRDKTADEVLKESYDKYREVGWINPLQRQKPGIYGLGSKRGQTISKMMKNA